jgi:transposase InsO family protein
VIRRLREAFPSDSALKYLICDNDSIFSDDVTEAIKSFGIRPRRTAFQSPWQNGTAERWVGLCKREIIDHVTVFNEDHLRRLLRDSTRKLALPPYYYKERVHTVLRDSPTGRPVEARPSPEAKVIGLPRVGGLHYRYAWQEAA